MSSSLILLNNDRFSIELWNVMKSGFYMATGDDQLSGWTEKKLQSQTRTRKWSWSLLGDLLLLWCTIAFWILVKPLHLRSMLSKSMRCTENCNVYSWHWATEWANSSALQCPTARHTTNTSEVEWIGLRSFASSTITWPLANWLPLLKTSPQLFSGKTLPQPEEAENAFQEFVESWSTDFYTTGIKELISN